MKTIKLLLLTGLLLSVTNVFSQDPNFYIFLCFGQSNMVGGGTIEAQDRTVDSRFQTFQAVNCSNLGRIKGNWYPATPPLCRCYHGLGPTDYFGRTMVANLPSNVRVGVVMVAIEGASIELFDKYNFRADLENAPDWLKAIVNNDYGGNPYQYLIDLARLAKNEGVIKGILLHQGETNYGDTQWPSKVKTIYNYMMSDLGLNPASVPLLAGQLAGGGNGGMNGIINTLPQVLPNSYVVSSDGCEVGSDGIHFTSAGYRELGRHYGTTMLSLLGSCTPTSITSYIQVNDGAWQQTSGVTVNSGDKVKFGPQPVSGGSWSWSGCGTSGTSREQTVYPTSSCTSTATYTNSCGAQSTQNFTVTISGSSSDIADGGVYRITPRNGGKSVDVSGCGTANGTNVQNWAWLDNDCQKWQFNSISGGYWKISPSYSTGKALDVSGVSTADGANIHIWDYLGGTNQQWQVVNLNNGYYQIVARHSGKCLDLQNGSTADGANFHQWTCSGSNTNQHFTFTRIKSAREVLPESLMEYSLYPSPANKDLNITLRGQDYVNVKIYNNLGALVLSSKFTGNSKAIDVSKLSPGIYIIRLEGNAKTITDRFIKK